MAQDILQMLLQSKGVNSVGGPTQQNVAGALPFPVSILPNLLRMAGVASTTQPGKEGEGQRVASEVATQLNPMQEVVQKEVLKGLKTITKDAMTQTNDPMGMAQYIMQQSGIPLGAGSGASGAPPAQQEQNVVGQPGEQALTQAMAGQPMRTQGQPQQQGRTDLTGMDILKGFLPFLAMPELLKNTIEQSRYTTEAARQKVSGEEPLQRGKAEELELTALGNLMSTGNKAVSAETGKLLGNVRSGMQQIDLLEQAFTTNPNAFKQIATPGNAQAQAIQTTIADLTDIIGRLRSGGAINKDEEKRFMSQVPKFGFIAGRMEAPGAVKFKLKKLRNLFNEIEGLTQPDQSGLAGRIQQAVGAGYSMQEIRKRLKAKGEL